jgi:hypothetical protein
MTRQFHNIIIIIKDECFLVVTSSSIKVVLDFIPSSNTVDGRQMKV